MSDQDKEGVLEEQFEHVPVLPEEVIEYLAPKEEGRYLDGTLGLGGHTQLIFEHTGGKAYVLGLDKDEQALAAARKRLHSYEDRLLTAHAAFADAAEMLDEAGWNTVDGALLDLGVSSLQLNYPERGFSFLQDGPLDMRMDQGGGSGATGQGMTASRLVNKAGMEELKYILGKYGEEPMGGRIAAAIVKARVQKPLETTKELADLVERAYPAKRRAAAKKHPATKTFQALRMAVNKEVEELETFLETMVDRIAPGGRIVIISFHSIEDRIVKRAFRTETKGCLCPSRQPVCTCGHVPKLRLLTKKPVGPSEAEIATNKRSRSAKLRAARRLGPGEEK